jgi:hypothetical protein
MDPNQGDMAVPAIAVQVAQDQRKVLTARRYGVPMELEDPVCRWQYGRHDLAYPVWFGHQTSLT